MSEFIGRIQVFFSVIKKYLIDFLGNSKKKKALIIIVLLVMIFSIKIYSLNNVQKNISALNTYLSDKDLTKAKDIIKKNNSTMFSEKSVPIFENYIEKYRLEYNANKSSKEDYSDLLNLAYTATKNNKYKDISEAFKNELDSKEKLNQSNKDYVDATELLNKGYYIYGIKKLKAVINEDENYNSAQEYIDKYLVTARNEIINTIKNKIDKNDFDGALNDISNLIEISPDDEEVKNYKKEIEDAKVNYERKLEEIEKANKAEQEEEKERQEEERKRQEQEKERQATEKKNYDKAYSIAVNDIKSYSYNNKNTQLKYDGIKSINGVEYYIFYNTIDGEIVGDSRHIVSKNSFEHSIEYSDGTIITNNDYINHTRELNREYIEISIAELNARRSNYSYKYVTISGIVSYIDESKIPKSIVIQDNNGQYASAEYIESTNKTKGEYATIKGLVSIETSEFINMFGTKVTMPKIELAKIQ